MTFCDTADGTLNPVTTIPLKVEKSMRVKSLHSARSQQEFSCHDLVGHKFSAFKAQWSEILKSNVSDLS